MRLDEALQRRAGAAEPAGPVAPRAAADDGPSKRAHPGVPSLGDPDEEDDNSMTTVSMPSRPAGLVAAPPGPPRPLRLCRRGHPAAHADHPAQIRAPLPTMLPGVPQSCRRCRPSRGAAPLGRHRRDGLPPSRRPRARRRLRTRRPGRAARADPTPPPVAHPMPPRPMFDGEATSTDLFIAGEQAHSASRARVAVPDRSAPRPAPIRGPDPSWRRPSRRGTPPPPLQRRSQPRRSCPPPSRPPRRARPIVPAPACRRPSCRRLSCRRLLRSRRSRPCPRARGRAPAPVEVPASAPEPRSPGLPVCRP